MKNIIKLIGKSKNLSKNLEYLYCKIPYIFGNGKAFAPLSIVLLVSYRCNLRCKMCFYYNESEKDHTKNLIEKRKNEELSLEQIYKIIDDASAMKVKVLTIHGGEPLLYPKIFDVANYAQEKGLLVNFVTNGTLLNKEVAEKIINSRINQIIFSLDGPEEIHDDIRNVKGTFRRLLSGIKNIKELEKKGKKIPHLCISTYVSAINQNCLGDMIEIVSKTGIKNWDVGLITHNTEKLTRVTSKILNIGKKENQGSLENLKEKVKKIRIGELKNQRKILLEKNKKYKLNIIFPSEKAINNYYNPNFNEMNYCLIPWSRAVISPYGEVFPCVNLSMINCVMGNIKNNSLRKIWNGKKYVEFRRKLKKNKLFPVCSKCCHINNVRRLED